MSTEQTRKQSIAKQIGKVKNRTSMVAYLTLFILGVISITAVVIYLIYYLLLRFGVIVELNLYWAGFILLLFCIVVSTSLVRGFGNRILFGSLRQIIDASKAVAAGDFTQRLEPTKEKETAEICESFNEMVDRLGRNEMLARDFISNVSHQFRNPLASISGYAQLLESGDISESERREYAGIIREKSMSLSELVNDILELSKIERGGEFGKEKFQADEQLYKCLLGFDTAFKEKDIDLQLDVHPTVCLGNVDLIAEVFNNLIENAVKFSNHGGSINVKLAPDDTAMVFSVSDNGVGMSDETIERLFERFYRGKEASATVGSGLGLSIVNNIVNLHNGSITVESKLGWGSRFTVTIPNTAEE